MAMSEEAKQLNLKKLKDIDDIINEAFVKINKIINADLTNNYDNRLPSEFIQDMNNLKNNLLETTELAAADIKYKR